MFEDRLADLKQLRIALTEGKEKFKPFYVDVETGKQVYTTEAARAQCAGQIAELERLWQQG